LIQSFLVDLINHLTSLPWNSGKAEAGRRQKEELGLKQLRRYWRKE
jgi:hypothetical protein